MSHDWTPQSHRSITDAGMVIEIELGGIQTSSLQLVSEENQLCIRGRHEDLGSFESRFHVPPGYSPESAKVSFENGVMRIDMPPNKDSFLSKPVSMLIYCKDCGKHFEIVVRGKGTKDYRCPACGKVEGFDLGSLMDKALEQTKKMLGKNRGGWRL